MVKISITAIILSLLVMFTYAITFVATEVDPLAKHSYEMVDRTPCFRGDPDLALKYTIHS